MSKETPEVGQIWIDKRGKRRRVTVVIMGGSWSYRIAEAVCWESVGPNHGQNRGRMLIDGWLKRFKLEG